MVRVELAAKPVPVTFTVFPTGPLSGVREMLAVDGGAHAFITGFPDIVPELLIVPPHWLVMVPLLLMVAPEGLLMVPALLIVPELLMVPLPSKLFMVQPELLLMVPPELMVIVPEL